MKYDTHGVGHIHGGGPSEWDTHGVGHTRSGTYTEWEIYGAGYTQVGCRWSGKYTVRDTHKWDADGVGHIEWDKHEAKYIRNGTNTELDTYGVLCDALGFA